MEKVDVLIVGQGLAGSWLSWWLDRTGLSYRVMDDADPSSASRHAAGLINPVTGRRMVKTWMIDELMPFAWRAYQDMGGFLQTNLITETSVIDFFPNVQMLQAFQKRSAEEPSYLTYGQNATMYNTWFRYDLGWGVIHPCYLVQTEKLLFTWRSRLLDKGSLREEEFNMDKLVVREPVYQYEDLSARYIIFCDGKVSAGNKFFEKLPFALNKGEGLLVEIQEIPQTTIFKKGMSLIPWKDHVFWVGSSYQWEFSDDQPSENFLRSTENWMKNFLQVPYKIVDHFAAVRPATLERRPFVGFHPQYAGMGILNGLGTKGCSLAPYFAAQLAEIMAGRGVIDPLADIKRFRKILLK
ncbi:MAG: FAD-binding oxidoreductase [Bacteroidota bacterium]|nr:FAD-binding oxidoreductase [Bacteroidota bacterium]MDP4249806.1 FAD-binding oxidoreductase [Bacteroidota bacterium]